MKISFIENLLALVENHAATVNAFSVMMSAACAVGMLVIAIVNFIFGLKKIKLQEEHNRMALCPKCDIVCSETGGIIKMSLYNYGNGAMTVKSLKIENKDTGSVLHNAYETVPATIGLKYYSLSTKGRNIVVNGHIKLIEIDKRKLRKEQYSQLRKALSRYIVTVSYQDIREQGPCMETAKDLADFFGRNYR